MQCFKTTLKENSGRLDCDYYKPEYVELENKVNCLTKLTLKDFVKYIAGGATPDIDKKSEYYTQNKDEGIPFIRVQNLSEEGLIFDSMKYIKPIVHEKMLKRSQVHAGDLITKITGVGRMAISSMAPDGFEGNINQHSVIIKTENKDISEYLAIYLNLDFVEKLASRRTTGGTRPALDYASLQTIPVIYKPDIVPIIKKAIALKKEKEENAIDIINSIENIILDCLDIKNYSSSDKKAFSIKCKDVQNKRLDVYGYQLTPRTVINAIKQSRYGKTITPLNSLILENFAGDWGEDIEKDLNDNYSICNVIRNKNFNNVYNIDYGDIAQRKILNTKKEKILLKKGDILIEKSGGSPQQPVGRVAYIDKDIDNYVFSNFLQCIRINSELCDPEYLFIYLRTIYKLNYMKYIQSQTIGIINLLMDDFLNIPIIILKDKDAQREIVDKYNEMHNKAKQLQEEAKDEFKKTKVEVEKMILGEE